jgi:hypothetical protein
MLRMRYCTQQCFLTVVPAQAGTQAPACAGTTVFQRLTL